MLRLVKPSLFEQDPVEIYLQGKSRRGRRSQKQKLEVAAEVLGVQLCDLHLNLSFQSSSVIRAALCDIDKSASTVNATLAGLRGVAKVAVHLKLITPEAYEGVRAVSSVRGSRELRGRWVSTEERAQVFAACDESVAGVRDAAVLAVLFGAGLRREECAMLRVPHYSPKDETLLVRGKGNKERIVPCPAAAPFLEEWLLVIGHGDGSMFRRIVRGVVTDDSLSDQAVHDIYKTRAKKAGLASTSPHDARRTFCTEMLDAGHDLNVVSKLMGHASITTTARYDMRGERAKRKAAASVKLPMPRRSQHPANAPRQLALEPAGPSGDLDPSGCRATARRR